MTTSTTIINATKHTMKLKVGNTRHASHLATLEAGGKHSIAVDVNATYREYIVQIIDEPGVENVTVSSDDLCDNKRTTIKEEDGKLNLLMDSRHSEPDQARTSKLAKWLPAWMSKSEQ